MRNKIVLAISSLFFIANVQAFDTTGLGKIVSTQGHEVPACRTVKFKDNQTGTEKNYRINGGDGGSDIMSVTLSALIANRDVTISYEPGVTSGCGPENRILFVTVF